MAMSSGTSISVLSIQIPEDAEPGDTLQFDSNGQMLELVVPVGSVPGDVLEIQIGSTSTEDTSPNHKKTNNETQNVTVIDIGNGLTVEFLSQLPDDYHGQSTTTTSHDDYGGKTNTGSDNNTDNDNNDGDNDGTFALPWQSGIELANHWRDISKLLLELGIHSKRRILELGSGLGVVGVSLAMTTTVAVHNDHHRSSNEQSYHPLVAKDAAIILTDLPAAMPLLEFNVEHHQPKLMSSSSSTSMLSTRTLRWRLEHEPDQVDSLSFANEPPFDMIVGSDLLYNTEYIPHLIATMKRFLHPTRGIVVLAVRWRKPELERTFFQQSGLDWQLLVLPPPAPGGTTPSNKWYQYCSSLSWKEFGDPSNEASNKYFHQTQISVNGQPQSLATITEEQAQGLPPEEFLAWERSFIQFYVGRPKTTLLV